MSYYICVPNECWSYNSNLAIDMIQSIKIQNSQKKEVGFPLFNFPSLLRAKSYIYVCNSLIGNFPATEINHACAETYFPEMSLSN